MTKSAILLKRTIQAIPKTVEIAVMHILLECLHAHVLADQFPPASVFKLDIPNTVHELAIFVFALE
jgi:hypothetical protein